MTLLESAAFFASIAKTGFAVAAAPVALWFFASRTRAIWPYWSAMGVAALMFFFFEGSEVLLAWLQTFDEHYYGANWLTDDLAFRMRWRFYAHAIGAGTACFVFKAKSF